MQIIALVIFGIVLLLPLVLPWTKTLGYYSIFVWFSLWGAFYYFSHAEVQMLTNGFISQSTFIGLTILVFSVSVALRFLIHGIAIFISRRVKK